MTVPAPVPLGPEVIVSQLSLLAAIQLQVELTDMLPLPPPDVKGRPVGEIEKAQPGFCVMVKVCPEIVIVPVRAGPTLAATEKLSVPLPVPLDAEVSVMKLGLLLTALQSQPEPAVIVTLPLPPSPVKFWLAGLSEKVQAALLEENVHGEN